MIWLNKLYRSRGGLKKFWHSWEPGASLPVITGLVPVIPMMKRVAPQTTEMAGTDPRITSGDGHDVKGREGSREHHRLLMGNPSPRLFGPAQ
jgi:hypothetical protein